ncbi:hypothetical protein MIZ03_0128 [Rhodoferax lithotrophicus]|uniref:Uncharacterized protein n=1 Tax=Rhodoferax lithotrophicus TaxID=2798804 RepID=A0ABM7MGH3_9BURK|nr:hypothetical protein [Rhodoferax sp. MIZ03]BCO25268.1 hypothetical protein MIZ03_0128 [Rhodoferax sp. MIZ03]
MKAKSARCWMMVWLLVASTTALARGPLRASEGNTSGWHLMSAQERIDHQSKIRSFKTLEACRAYQAEHHQLMLARAQSQGQPLRLNHRDFCAHLSADKARP